MQISLRRWPEVVQRRWDLQLLNYADQRWPGSVAAGGERGHLCSGHQQHLSQKGCGESCWGHTTTSAALKLWFEASMKQCAVLDINMQTIKHTDGDTDLLILLDVIAGKFDLVLNF